MPKFKKNTSAFRMKGSPMKRNFDLKGYFRGEQGLIPDYKGKTTRSRMNQSKLFNPKSSDEIMSDKMVNRMYGEKLKEKTDAMRTGKKFSEADERSFKHYQKLNKQVEQGLRPHKKDRY